MKLNVIFSGFLLGISLMGFIPVHANQVSLFKTEQDACIFSVEQYNKGCHYYNQKEWQKAANEFEAVINVVPDSEVATDAYYFLGVCFFQLQEYDFANQAFTQYLKTAGQPEFFEEAIHYKFCIAEYFKGGHRRRLFKIRYCPKWATARTMALNIYDEIIVAMPNHEWAARSLYSKGCLLLTMSNYREAIEAFQTLIRRFPKDELTPLSYLKIAETYCIQSVYEYQNPDLLSLAEINARRFKEMFPRDEQIEIVEGYVARIKENYAKGLCDIGLFYERVQLPNAAAIYYQSAIEEFPDTRVAAFCQRRLLGLGFECEEEELSPSQPVVDLTEEQKNDEVCAE